MRSGEGGSRTSALCTRGRRHRPGRPASARRSSPGARWLCVASSTGARHFTTGAAQRSRCDAPTAVRSGSSGSPCGDGPFPSTRASGSQMRRQVSSGGSRVARRRSYAARRSRPRSPRLSSPAASRASALGGRSSCRSTQCTSSSSSTASCGSRTSEGRVRAAARGLDALEARLAPAGFLRVSRTAIVNLRPGARDRAVVQGRRVGGDRRRGVGRGVEAPRSGASSRPRPLTRPRSEPRPATARNAGSTARRPHRFQDASAAR